MAIVNSYLERNRLLPEGQREVHEYHISSSGKSRRFIYTADIGTDPALLMNNRVSQVEFDLAEEEVNTAIDELYKGNSPDKVAEEQSQADFDRRVLGRIMGIADAHLVLLAYPFFLAVQTRGGANNSQRATYLGVPSDEYNLVDSRFSNVNGISWFLTDEKNQIWNKVLEGWE